MKRREISYSLDNLSVASLRSGLVSLGMVAGFNRNVWPICSEYALDSIIKHLRIARGAALCAAVFTFLAFLKFLGALLIFLVSVVCGDCGRWGFVRVIDPTATASITKGEILKATMCHGLVYFATVALAAGFYFVTLQGYLTAEREYHGLAHFGAVIGKAKFDSQMDAQSKLPASDKKSGAGTTRPRE